MKDEQLAQPLHHVPQLRDGKLFLAGLDPRRVQVGHKIVDPDLGRRGHAEHVRKPSSAVRVLSPVAIENDRAEDERVPAQVPELLVDATESGEALHVQEAGDVPEELAGQVGQLDGRAITVLAAFAEELRSNKTTGPGRPITECRQNGHGEEVQGIAEMLNDAASTVVHKLTSSDTTRSFRS